MKVVEDIGKYLAENGIKPSYQRMKVFEYLLKNRTHPAVDTIYRALVEEIPTLSKTTVYNTLKLFIEKRIAVIINIEDNETRYDADTSLHGHFKCKKCNKVYDFKIAENSIGLDDVKNFKIEETHVYIKGICDNCNK